MSNSTSIANPAPLGLIGFGMTTILLNLHNAGIIPLSIVIVGMGIALGGLAQIIAGVMEFKTGNVFGATAFTAYGTFWWSLVLIWIFPKPEAADLISMGFYLLLWGIFTGGMFIGSLKHNKATQVVFGSLTILFLLLATADFLKGMGMTDMGTMVQTIAGFEGIFCGASAIYNSLGQVINNEYGKEVVKLG